MSIKMSAREFVKKVAFRHLGMGRPNYPYGLEPGLLGRIALHVERIKGTGQSIVEAGVARGMTTRFIAQSLKMIGADNPIFAIDTFAGFVPEHLEFEKAKRHKNVREMVVFEYNDAEIWRRNLRDCPMVKAIAADIGQFDFSPVAPIGILILDVDLYLPTKRALANARPHLAKDAVIYLDDIADGGRWDGAYQAYMEFTRESGLRCEQVGQKSAVICID